MKITQLTTETALHMPGVGTLPISLIRGKGSKYPNLEMTAVDCDAGRGIKVTINSKSCIIPYSQIKTIMVEDGPEDS